jgi:uncharacterized membrane protein
MRYYNEYQTQVLEAPPDKRYLQMLKIVGIVIMLAQLLDMYTTSIALETGFFEEGWAPTVWLVKRVGWGFPNAVKIAFAFGYPLILVSAWWEERRSWLLLWGTLVAGVSLVPAVANTYKYMQLYYILEPYFDLVR